MLGRVGGVSSRLVRVGRALPMQSSSVMPSASVRGIGAASRAAWRAPNVRHLASVVDVESKFALFSDQWSPKVVGQVNDMHVKLAKVQGDFVWHHHEDTDELFWVVKGVLSIDIKGEDDTITTVHIEPGQFYVVPRGVDHRPFCEEECHIMLLEPAGTVNTGSAKEETASQGGIQATQGEWIA